MPAVVLVSGGGEVISVPGAAEAAAVVRARAETFTVYAPESVFREIRDGSVDEENREDHARIAQYRAWKGQARQWGDIDELSDWIEEARERIGKRLERLRHGGERHPDPPEATDDASA